MLTCRSSKINHFAIGLIYVSVFFTTKSAFIPYAEFYSKIKRQSTVLIIVNVPVLIAKFYLANFTKKIEKEAYLCNYLTLFPKKRRN